MMSLLRELVLCDHPLDQQAQVFNPQVTIQWCKRCGAARFLNLTGVAPWVHPSLVVKATEEAVDIASKAEEPK